MSIEKVLEFRKLILDLDKLLSDYFLENPDIGEAGELLTELNNSKRDLSSVYDVCAKKFSNIMEDEKIITLSTGVMIEKKSSYDRKGWKHQDLTRAVVGKLTQMSVDMDTGEVLKSPEEIAIDLMKYCAPSYWRIKELNSIGINADMYSETGDLKTSIIIRKGDSK
jgi:hypothetical protein